MKIETYKEFIAALRSGPYTSSGSYPVYFICKDGENLSFKAAKENALQIGRAIRDNNDSQWQVIATEINWENTDLYCADTEERIESAYGEFDPGPVNDMHDASKTMNVFICSEREIKCESCKEIVDCAGGCGCLRNSFLKG